MVPLPEEEERASGTPPSALVMRIAAEETGHVKVGRATEYSVLVFLRLHPERVRKVPSPAGSGDNCPAREVTPFRLKTVPPAAWTSPAPLGRLRKL